LGLFRSDFASGDSAAMSVGEWRWRGISAEIEPGGTYEAQVTGGGVETHVHRERHYPPETVRATMEASGLEFLASLGQQEGKDGVLLVDPPDEMRDHKIIYIGRAVA
jgi:hypothetical protein